MKLIRPICLVCLSLLASLLANANMAVAQMAIQIEPELVVCPSEGWVSEAPVAMIAPTAITTPLPDFSASHCRSVKFWEVDPQGTQIWLQAIFHVPTGALDKLQPLALFVSAKMSSQIYVNGVYLGENGTPGTDRRTEFPGRMDAYLYLPRSMVKDGSNELVMRVSSHEGFLKLSQSIHWIGLDTYEDPTANRLEHYWPSLFPFGILFLGAICFGLLAIVQRRGWQTAFLPFMSLFAAGQLCFEVSRGLVPYLYPFQETRLIMILVFATGFGLSLLAHILCVLTLNNKKAWFTACAALTLGAIFLQPGFDGKSTLAMIVPASMSLALACYLKIRKKQPVGNLILALGGFLLIVLLAPGAFLDIYFFYIVAAFLAVLFVQQVLVFADEHETRMREQARADKLQMIIDQNEDESAQRTLSVNSANESKLVLIADIAYCKGAGDYVELVLGNGNTILHNDSLNELEQNLPSSFLRVHRSYIVNTSLISSLQRKASGTGVLLLKNGESVQVSRRVMPNVKERLIKGSDHS